ncbi:MAG: type 1 glutamine amidotransferase [Thermoguttaceae bacterium]
MGSLPGALAEAGLLARQFDLFELVPDSLPWNEAAGLIVLGGTMSANDGDRFPFLVAELDWIRTAVHGHVPTLGICLGAQLLAKALGAAVYRNAQQEIGWYRVELLPAAADDCLFRDCSGHETVFHWHGDTFDLPAGAINLARSPLCGHQAFRHGALAYGLQFHVEMVPELMELWLREFDTGEASCAGSRLDAAAIRAAAAGAFPAMNSFSQCLLKRFAAMCKA